MFDKDKLKDIERRQAQWHKKVSGVSERRKRFTTVSGAPVERVYTPANIADLDYERDMGFPGEYPFLRAVHSTGQRGRLWTMRMFSGFGTAEESNARYKYLLEHGETGLSVAFDYPTLMGHDTDAPEARGEFGKCGVAVSSLADMELLFAGIPVDKVTTSMTINGPAAVIWSTHWTTATSRWRLARISPRMACGASRATSSAGPDHRWRGRSCWPAWTAASGSTNGRRSR